MNTIIFRSALLCFALFLPAFAAETTPSGVTPAQPGAPGDGATPASPALENRGERMERRGERRENRGERMQRRGRR